MLNREIKENPAIRNKRKKKNTKRLHYLQSSAFILMSTDACVVGSTATLGDVDPEGRSEGEAAVRGADVVCLQLLWTFKSGYVSVFFFFSFYPVQVVQFLQFNSYRGFPALLVRRPPISELHVRFIRPRGGSGLRHGDGIRAARWLVVLSGDLRAVTLSSNCPAGNAGGLPSLRSRQSFLGFKLRKGIFMISGIMGLVVDEVLLAEGSK